MGSPAATYRPDIDGLRAIAVLGVVFCHVGIGLPGGYVGVDVFFVISGYLITKIIATDIEKGTFSLGNFWLRRIRRIVPALSAMTIATLIAGYFILLPDSYESLGKSVIALVLLSSNILFWRQINYFAPEGTEKPLLHTWSLAVEEQFYLLFPILIFFLITKRRA